MNTFIPRDEYLRTLPGKIVGVGTLLRNENNEFLIVKPSYRKEWLIPGGTTDENESLVDAARRETKEEIGIEVELERMLLIEYKYHSDNKDNKYDSLQCVFLGKRLTKDQVKNIKIDEDEIVDFQFVSFERMLEMLISGLSRRLSMVKDFDKFYYLECGKLIFEN